MASTCKLSLTRFTFATFTVQVFSSVWRPKPSSSPTLLSQTSKVPKNPRTKFKIKTDQIGNPNPKIKKYTLKIKLTHRTPKPKNQKIHSDHHLGHATQASATQAARLRSTSSDHGRSWARLLQTNLVMLLRKLQKAGVAIGGDGGGV